MPLRNEILRTEKTFKPNLPGLKNLAGLVYYSILIPKLKALGCWVDIFEFPS